MHTTCCTQHCCDMLHGNVAVIWPGLVAMLANYCFVISCVVLKCCDHLAWSIHIFTLNGSLAVSHIQLILLIQCQSYYETILFCLKHRATTIL